MVDMLFDPLDMDTTTPSVKDAARTDNFALPYTRAQNPDGFRPFPRYINDVLQVIGPAGSVSSSLSDMTKWLRFLTSGGKNSKGEQLISTLALKKTWTPATILDQFNYLSPFFPVSFVSTGYAAGWIRAEYRGRWVNWHTGGTLGHSTVVAWMPDEEIGFVWITNLQGAEFEGLPLMLAAFDVALGYEPWINATTAITWPCPWDPACHKKKPEVETPQAKIPDTKDHSQCPPNLSDYLGVYEAPLIGTWEISLASPTSLLLSLGNTFCLINSTNYYGNDLFTGLCDHFSFLQFNFLRSFSGPVSGLRIPGPDIGELNIPELHWKKSHKQE